MDDKEILEVLYDKVRERQVRCAADVGVAELVDVRNHRIGMFSAYSEVLNLIDEELSRKKS